MDVASTESTPLDRHTAAVAATRAILETANTTSIIPERTPGDVGHIDLLNFYERAGERMVSSRTNQRWQAVASGTIDFGDGS